MLSTPNPMKISFMPAPMETATKPSDFLGSAIFTGSAAGTSSATVSAAACASLPEITRSLCSSRILSIFILVKEP